MNNLVKITKDNDVAIITIDNPPVNALSPGVPEAIGAAIDEMNNDPSVKAAVVIGAGRTFVAGADIKEFIKMTSSGARRATLLPLLLHIEDSGKPVVMAIHGNAFGGGLELAMAGHYRLASPSAQVGQPEVKLGIIPGAGGTQRLPRLVGVAKAVEMCAEGMPVHAREAAALGLIDRLIEGDLLAGAVAFAREIADRPRRRRGSDRKSWERLRRPWRFSPRRARRPRKSNEGRRRLWQRLTRWRQRQNCRSRKAAKSRRNSLPNVFSPISRKRSFTCFLASVRWRRFPTFPRRRP